MPVICVACNKPEQEERCLDNAFTIAGTVDCPDSEWNCSGAVNVWLSGRFGPIIDTSVGDVFAFEDLPPGDYALRAYGGDCIDGYVESYVATEDVEICTTDVEVHLELALDEVQDC